MIGQIIKIQSDNYIISSDGKHYNCTMRGKLRQESITPQVGDYVCFDLKTNCIEKIQERKNSLSRPNVSNIDQVIIVTSLKHPDFSDNLLDKLLVTCVCTKVKPIICLTKKDLLTRDEFKKLKVLINYYKKLNYKVLYNTNLFRIKRLLKNKTTVLTGQTGAGKSTLMNKLDKHLNFETNEISNALGRGKHTTKYVTLVEMYKGKVLDTPGFSAIDLNDLTKEEIRNSFPEFKVDCPYKNCSHINEKDCSVKKLVIAEKIMKSRYENYIKFISVNKK